MLFDNVEHGPFNRTSSFDPVSPLVFRSVVKSHSDTDAETQSLEGQVQCDTLVETRSFVTGERVGREDRQTLACNTRTFGRVKSARTFTSDAPTLQSTYR